MLIPHYIAAPDTPLCAFLTTQVEMLEHIQCSRDQEEQVVIGKYSMSGQRIGPCGTCTAGPSPGYTEPGDGRAEDDQDDELDRIADYLEGSQDHSASSVD